MAVPEYFTIDGCYVKAIAFDYTPQKIKREALIGQSGTQGYKPRIIKSASATVTFAVDADFDLNFYQDLKFVTWVAGFDDRKNVGTNSQVEDVKENEDGSVTIKFVGNIA